MGQHPIRPVRELINYLGDHKSVFSVDGKEFFHVDLWGGRAFSAALLDEYPAPDSPVYKILWDSFLPADEELVFGQTKVRVKRYGLHVPGLMAAIARSAHVSRLDHR